MSAPNWPLRALLALAIVAGFGWIVHKTSWVEVDEPVTPHGAAARPYFSLRRVASAAGTRFVQQPALDAMPPPTATLLLFSTDWDLFPDGAERLHAWVRDGGQLVVFRRTAAEEAMHWLPPVFVEAPRPRPAKASPDDDDDDDDDAPAPSRPGQAHTDGRGDLPPLLADAIDGPSEQTCEDLAETPDGASVAPGRRLRRCLSVPQRAAYEKFHNPASHFALTGVFVAQFADGSVRVAITGAAPSVFRATALEDALKASFMAAAARAVSIAPDELNTDLHASAAYRAHLIPVLAARAVTKALG